MGVKPMSHDSKVKQPFASGTLKKTLQNKLSEVSEVVEEDACLEEDKSCGATCHTSSPVRQRNSLNTTSASFYQEDLDDPKFSYNTKKIFVGGLPHGLSEEEFQAYFEKYGEIEDCVVMYDRATGKPRGFGFVTYKDERSIDLVLRNKAQHKIHNKWIECKRATPKTSCNDSGSWQEKTSNTSFTYNSDVVLLPCTYEPLSRKLSVESLAFPAMNEIEGVPVLQTTSPSIVLEPNDDLIKKDIPAVDQSYASYDEPPKEKYFSSLIPTEEARRVVEKIESLQWDEDKMTTYSEIFENCHKSENGSDWNVSGSDLFDAKEYGFPQSLPTSDIGGIFNKYKSKFQMSD